MNKPDLSTPLRPPSGPMAVRNNENDCDDCGEWSSSLIEGVCPVCRALPNRAYPTPKTDMARSVDHK